MNMCLLKEVYMSTYTYPQISQDNTAQLTMTEQATNTTTTVTNYKCERCGDVKSTKSNLLQHLRKQKPCKTTYSTKSREDIIDELRAPPLYEMNVENMFACEYCNKALASAPSKCQHKRICPRRPEMMMQTMIRHLQEELNKSKSDIIDLRNQLTQSVVTNINNNTTIQNQQNNIIIVNNYGNEAVPQFTPEFLNNCLLNPSKGLPSLIEKIHYNPDLPENHNLRHKSTKSNLFQKRIDSDWHDCDASNTLDDLIKKGYRILSSFFSEHVANDPSYGEDEMKMMMYERFRFLGDKKSLEYSAVKRDLRLLVKDKTIYLLASFDTHINSAEIQELQHEIVGAFSSE
jgi:hypothetical protein